MENIKRCMYIVVLLLSIVPINGCDKKTSTENTPTQEENFIDQENNILPLYATINVQYPEGVKEGEWAEGELPNFCFIMIREDENSPFYVYDKGF